MNDWEFWLDQVKVFLPSWAKATIDTLKPLMGAKLGGRTPTREERVEFMNALMDAAENQE